MSRSGDPSYWCLINSELDEGHGFLQDLIIEFPKQLNEDNSKNIAFIVALVCRLDESFDAKHIKHLFKGI